MPFLFIIAPIFFLIFVELAINSMRRDLIYVILGNIIIGIWIILAIF